MGNHSATYTDSRGRQLDIEVDEDASAWVGLRLSENREPLGIVIPADKRETLARALAGDGYRVVSAQEWKIAYDAGFEAGKKYAQQSQPGTSDRGHAVFQFDATCPICAKAEAQAAQPDRPAPVDPSEVRKGDLVEISYEGEVARPAVNDTTLGFKNGDRIVFHDVARATVRILRRAEPEPDPAAVEALSAIVKDIVPETVGGIGWDDFARELIRRGVEVPDA